MGIFHHSIATWRFSASVVARTVLSPLAFRWRRLRSCSSPVEWGDTKYSASWESPLASEDGCNGSTRYCCMRPCVCTSKSCWHAGYPCGRPGKTGWTVLRSTAEKANSVPERTIAMCDACWERQLGELRALINRGKIPDWPTVGTEVGAIGIFHQLTSGLVSGDGW